MKKTLVLILALFMVLSFSPWASAGTTYKDDNITIDDSAIYPTTDGGISCGQTGNEFSVIYADRVNSGAMTEEADTPDTITTAEGGSTFIATSSDQGGKSFDLPTITSANDGLWYKFVMGSPVSSTEAGDPSGIPLTIQPQDDAAIFLNSKGTDGVTITADPDDASDSYPTIELVAFGGDWYVVDYKGAWATGS